MDTYKEVSDFLEEKEPNYKELVADIKALMEDLKKSECHDLLYRVYSRSDKQDGSECKSKAKIIEKLEKKRSDNPNYKILSMYDIVGITGVVNYHDEIAQVYKIIKKKCESYKLKVINTKDKSDFGYFAFHIILGSEKTKLYNYLGELQIKTVLHDAWGSKTHDLTYKPNGELSEKHKTLMESFGDSIQSLEVQSETLRDLIKQDWFMERELRYAARTALSLKSEKRDFSDEEIQCIYNETYQLLKNNKTEIKMCSDEDEIIQNIKGNIVSLKAKENGIVAAWPLILLLASMRIDNSFNHMAQEYMEEWLKTISDVDEQMHHKTSSLHAIGERIKAIEFTKQHIKSGKLSEDREVIFKHNLLCYLIEEVSVSPKKFDTLKEECDELIESLGAENNIPEGAKKDTNGAYKIIFGDSDEEIEKGIRLCQTAYPPDTDENQEPGVLYCKLHERIGWRKLLR